MPQAMSVDRFARSGPGRAAAEPLAWWAALLAVYLALVSAVSLLEVTVGAVTAAAGAAAAVAARRALFADHADEGHGGEPSGDRPPVAPARAAGALARLPVQVVADTARVVARGATGGSWTTLSVAPGTAARGAATLLVSTSPGAYVGAVDPRRGRLRVHRLASAPSPFERRLRDAGLIAEPPPDGPTPGGGRS
jgi:hypothetical protein